MPIIIKFIVNYGLPLLTSFMVRPPLVKLNLFHVGAETRHPGKVSHIQMQKYTDVE